MNTIRHTKVAWIRNKLTPSGQPANGRLNCPCGNAPDSEFDYTQGHVYCECGTVYTWNGWIVQSAEK